MKAFTPYLLLIAACLSFPAVLMASWTAVVILALIGIGFIMLLALERFKPEQLPDPTGAELLAAHTEYKAEIKAELERLQSLIALNGQRPRLRE